MGTIHEFPLWRTRRPGPAIPDVEAQVVIFPGVRIERDEVARDQPEPMPRGERQAGEHGKP
jgi:hypothetical protein